VGREKPYVVKPLGAKVEPELAHHARWLAKRGVNLVKLLAAINPDSSKTPGAKLTDINEKERDWVWRAVAAYKKEGIYTTITFYWPADIDVDPAWGVGESLSGMLFVEPRVQEAYRGWVKRLLTEVNPYTGVPLGQDPSVAFITLNHEDSVLFWTFDTVIEKHPEVVGKLFWAWVEDGHLTREWIYKQGVEGGRLAGDKVGCLELYKTFQLTSKANGANASRAMDQFQFLVELQRETYAGLVRYIRDDLKCSTLINCGNWQPAEGATMFDAERWTYGPGDIDALNRYWGAVHEGPNSVWAIMKGDFVASQSVLTQPWNFPLNVRQIEGRPFVMTESSWTEPNAYRAEGPWLVSVYSSVTGLGPFVWFATGDEEWSPPRSPHGYTPGLARWDVATPEVVGQFPGAAWVYRKGMFERGGEFVEKIEPFSLMFRAKPKVPEAVAVDANPAARPSFIDQNLTTLFRTDRVRVRWEAEHTGTRITTICPPATYAEPDKRWDEENGVVVLDSWLAQGAVGFLDRRGRIDLPNVRIESADSYAAIVAVSFDDLPLWTSSKVLVQIGTQSRPTGYREEAAEMEKEGKKVAGVRIAETGGAPWRVRSVRGKMTIWNQVLTKATVLDANGMRGARVELKKEEKGVSFELPSGTLYVLLEK
jgi:hypothetical protein